MADDFFLPFLSARRRPKGGDLSQTVSEDGLGGFTPQGKNRVVLLIHGFNVDLESGRKAYAKLIANLRADWGFTTPLRGMVGFAWPGDWSNEILSPLSYPLQVPKSRRAGAMLADYIGKFSGPDSTPLEIVVIAHSLGSRVALEFVEALGKAAQERHGNVAVKALCLMAAAVPEGLVQSERGNVPASKWLFPAAIKPRERIVLHSRADSVLHYAFPPGEWAAGEGWATAVGRTGGPSGVWTDGQDMTRFGYGHGSYWGGAESADRIGALLGLAVPGSLASSPSAARDLPDARELPSGNAIESRILATRTIGWGI